MDEWWTLSVEIPFHREFSKQCKGKWSIKFRIVIPNMSYEILDEYILCYVGLTYNGKTLRIKKNKNNSKIESDNSRGYYDWLIDRLFNNGKQYTFDVATENIEYAPYDVFWTWEKFKDQKFTIQGKIKSRVPGYPWQIRE